VEFTLLAAALGSVAAVFAVLWLVHRGDAARLWDEALAAMMVGLLVGRLAAMVIAGTNPIARPADILIVRSGVDTGWASLGALVTAAIAGRRDPLGTLDSLAPAALAGLATWHASCLLREACLGTPSGLPWAVASSGSAVTRHPVELYAAALLAGGVVALAWWARRRPPPGRLAGVGLAIAAGVRLVTEPMRLALGSGPVAWYAAGIVVGALLAVAGPRAARLIDR
jgi:prolipoprotein diacylglyceryltransferase